jgi:hypothetical protein
MDGPTTLRWQSAAPSSERHALRAEASNLYYERVPSVAQEVMDRFARVTGPSIVPSTNSESVGISTSSSASQISDSLADGSGKRPCGIYGPATMMLFLGPEDSWP